jgi:lysophospholipase-3
MSWRTLTLSARLAIAIVFSLMPVASSAASQANATPGLTPVVVFPAYHFTKLVVTVQDQTIAPDCPASGTFEDWFQNDHPSTTFSQVCQDKLLTLRFDPDTSKPMPERFSDQPGVNIQIKDYGTTQSAPFYEALYKRLESAGYVRNQNIRVAGYDARLTPDMRGFLERTKQLVENSYHQNGNRPVHLVGHSNGPLYAQYLLTHTSREWRDTFIHGFTPIAGNFPGQGAVYLLPFTGLNITDFSFPSTQDNASSSAHMYLTAPSTYMSSSDPRVFDSQEVVIKDASISRSYTPQDFSKLFTDAGVSDAATIASYYIGFLKFTDPADFPYVDVYAEKGSGIPTVVGAVLPNLTVGQILSPSTQLLTRDGDINQEDITNNAVLAWRAMAPCFHFGLTDNAGVDHFSLPSHPDLLDRLVFDLGIDSRTNTYCKRQVIRERYAGQIEVATFNAVLASGQTLEAALAQAMAAKH